MGLLDDAIREHLDLKRRRGADPAEIERAEREALGPVRRDLFDPGAETGSEALGTETRGPAAFDDGEGAFDDEYYEDDEYGDEDDELEGWDENFEEDEPPLPREDEPPYDRGAPASVLGVEEPPSPRRADAGEQTVEYDVAAEFEPPTSDRRWTLPPTDFPAAAPGDWPSGQAPSEPDSGHDDDVLEETPDFLQDAPDHDRLWFEQRPPRDFDFDG